MRLVVPALLAVLATASADSPVHAAQPPPDVDLALVLAVDVSRSMDTEEQQLQRQGYVSAFRSNEVIQAIMDGARGRIAVTYFEWASPSFQSVLVPWTVIGGRADAEAFAARLAAVPFERESGTSISGGLDFAEGLLTQAQMHADRRAIDVSGDGPNNAGDPVVPTRDAIINGGVTINGLPIMLRTSEGGPFRLANLDDYYRTCVIGGPGAFMVTINSLADFEVATRRKLVLEISGMPPRVMPAADVGAAPQPVDCMIGEKQRHLLFDGMDNFH